MFITSRRGNDPARAVIRADFQYQNREIIHWLVMPERCRIGRWLQRFRTGSMTTRVNLHANHLDQGASRFLYSRTTGAALPRDDESGPLGRANRQRSTSTQRLCWTLVEEVARSWVPTSARSGAAVDTPSASRSPCPALQRGKAAHRYCLIKSLGFQLWSKNACLGPYKRTITRKPLPGTVRIQFLPVPGDSGPK